MLWRQECVRELLGAVFYRRVTSTWFTVLQSSISLLSFYLAILSTVPSNTGVVKSPVTMVGLSISPFGSVSLCSMYFGGLCRIS